MIPKLQGFSGLKFVGMQASDMSAGTKSGVIVHPLGKAIYSKAVPHWAASGLRGAVTRDMFVLFNNPGPGFRWCTAAPHVFTLMHPEAITLTLDRGYMVFTRNALITNAMVVDHHCLSVASLPEWETLKDRLQFGTLHPRDALALIPELGLLSASFYNTNDQSVTDGLLDPIIGDNLAALAGAATAEARAAVLKAILPRADIISSMFIVLDENYWFPTVFCAVHAFEQGTPPFAKIRAAHSFRLAHEYRGIAMSS